MAVRIKLTLITVLVFTSLTLMSCHYILEDKTNENEFLSKSQTRIDIHKIEAKLLLKASRTNLDILELCEVIKYVDTKNSVRALTTRLEKTHFEILKNYKDLAQDKLISIPSSLVVDNKLEDLTHTDKDAFIERKLKLILNKTETQIQLLDTLGNKTDSIEFKVLAIRDTPTLKSNMNNIVMTLNKYNQQMDRIKY